MGFYDDLRARGAQLPGMPVFDASSIAAMLEDAAPPDAEIDDNGLFSWPMSFFDGTLIPPFPQFFVEATTTIMFEGELITVRRGAVVSDHGAVLGGSRWTLAVEAYVEASGFLMSPSGGALIGIDHNGRLATDPAETPVIPVRRFPPIGLVTDVRESPRFNVVVMLALMAIHEKGDVIERQPSRQVKRMAERRGHPRPATVFELRHSVSVIIKSGAPRFAFTKPKESAGGTRNSNGRIGHIRMYGEKYGKGGLFGRKGESGNAVLWIPAEGSGHKSYRIDVWS